MRRLILVVLALLVTSALASAQPLVDRVPGDAFFYIGWRGTDTLGATYDQSHLAAIINGSNVKTLFDQTLPQLFEKLTEGKPEEAANVQATLPLLKHLWKRPTAFFAAPAFDKRGDFDGRWGLICDAGDVAADFEKGWKGLIDQAKQNKMKIATARDGNIVVLTIGYDDASALLKSAAAGALRGSAGFASAMKQVDADPVYTVFFDIERLITSIDQSVAARPEKKSASEWPRVRDALGLAGLKRYVLTGAFEGKDWSTRSFIEAPEPRKGIAALLEGQAIPPSTLDLIPRSAAFAMVRQFDPGKLFEQIRAAVATNPQDAAGFDRGLAKVQAEIGVDVRGLLDALGDQWAVYSDAGVGGAGDEGLVIVNQLHDAAKADASLKKLSDVIVQRSAGQAQFQVKAGDVKIGDELTVHYFQLPQGNPAWTVKNGKLYVAFKPETVGAATLVGTDKAPAGFSGNEKFAELRKRLMPGEQQTLTGFDFADLPQTAPQKYMQLQAYMPLIAMFAAGQNVFVPQNLLPPLDVVKANVAPAAEVAWVDASGRHARASSPFPGSSLFSSQQAQLVGVGGTALAISVLLPSLNRARETANRVKCASNMRQIGQGILLYSNDHRGKYPDDLGELMKSQGDLLTLEVFTCPSGDVEPPAEVANGTAEKKFAWAKSESPFTYVGKGMKNSADANLLVLYEREDDHGGDGMNMLFADGSVEWYAMETAKQIIQAGKRPAPQVGR